MVKSVDYRGEPPPPLSETMLAMADGKSRVVHRDPTISELLRLRLHADKSR